MRKTVGYFTLLAAVVLIACSASTLFWSAYDGAVDPWQKWIQGTQIVAVIIWEAGAVIAITYCFSHGHRVIGYAGTLLLILAMGYTLSEELRQQVGAQETAMAKRTAENGKLELVRSELDKAIARRDDLQKLRKPTIGQQNELATVRREIAELKDKWSAQIETPHAVVAPGVALIARWTKLNVTDSADLNPLIKMAFWTMARVFALPIAVFGISLLGAATLPVQAREVPKGMDVAPIASSPLLTRTARSEMAPWVAPSRKAEIHQPDDTPPPADAKPVAEQPGSGGGAPVKVAGPVLVTEDWKPASKGKSKKTKAERFEAVDVITQRWLNTGQAIRVAISLGSPGIAVYNSYSAWAATYGIKPVNPSHFGRSLKRLKVAKANKMAGVRYGLRLVKQEQRRAA